MNKSGKIVATPSEAKTPPGKRPFTVHSIVLEDGTKIEVGYKQPYSVGEYFNRSVETKFGALRDVGPAVAGEPEAAASPSPSASRTAGPTPVGRTFPVAKDSPEVAIIRQNALTNARELVTAAYVGSQPVPFGTSNTKAERQQWLDAVAEDVLYLAYKFADFSSGQREAQKALEQSRMNPPGA